MNQSLCPANKSLTQSFNVPRIIIFADQSELMVIFDSKLLVGLITTTFFLCIPTRRIMNTTGLFH